MEDHKGALKALADAHWKHKKRGGRYEILTHAVMQCNDPSFDYVEMTVYRNLDDGKVWVRPSDEFYDGRFEYISD